MEREGPPKVTILVDRRIVYAVRAIRFGEKVAQARRFGRTVREKVDRAAGVGRELKFWGRLLFGKDD